MKRPWVWVALSLMAGLYAAGMGWWPGFSFPLCVLGMALSAFLCPRTLPFRGHAVCVLVFFACGALCWNVRQTGPAGDRLSHYSLAHPNTELTLEGVVREAALMLPGADRQRLVLSVERIHTKAGLFSLSGGVLITWSQPDFPLHAGERIRVRGTLAHWLGPVNHGVSGIEDYYRRQGVCSRLYVRPGALERLGVSWWSPYYWASRLRVWEADAFQRAAPESVLPLVYTIWLGDSGQISGAPYDAYVQSGTAHVLSVSGVHVGIVYLSVGFVLGVLIRRRRLRSITMIGVLILFALTAGARVACMRATFMVVVYLAADLVNREPDTPTALSLSAILLLLLNPANIFDAGFILSFASVASILLFLARISALLDRAPWILRSNTAMTFAAQLLTIPFVALYFHVFAPIGFLANFIVIPLLTGVLWLCFFTLLSAAFIPPAALLFGHAMQPLAHLTQITAEMAAKMPLGHINLSRPSLSAALLYWAAMAALFMALGNGPRWKRWAAVTAVLLCAACALWKPWPLSASVDFLDTGHSDAAFVRTPAGATLLIDGGDKSMYSDMGAKAVIPFLYANGVTHLDYVIVSHPESDHIGGLISVVRTMPVGTAVLGPFPSELALEKEFLEACAMNGVHVQRVRAGENIPVDGATLEVLHPPLDWPHKKLNDASVVLRLAWPGLSVLFTGDIEHTAEMELTKQDCQAHVLKVPHHGSHTSSTAGFIGAVNPAYAVISTNSAGRGKPADSLVLKRYENRGISVLRTDYWGGIRLREKSGRWVFSGARITRGYSLEPLQE